MSARKYVRPWELAAAGIPAVDDVTLEISGGDLAVKAGGLTLDRFEEAALVEHAIPVFSQMRGLTGLVMTATPADSVWATLVSSNKVGVTSNLADGGTKTASGYVQFQLPPTYIADHDVQVKVTVELKSVTGTGVANNGSDIDLEVYEQSKSAGTVGSDLCATAAQTFAALDTVYEKTFTITDTGLAPGDWLTIKVVGRAIENDGGNGTLQVVIYNISVLCDEYGNPS